LREEASPARAALVPLERFPIHQDRKIAHSICFNASSSSAKSATWRDDAVKLGKDRGRRFAALARKRKGRARGPAFRRFALADH
jgi:hypothetical protein